VKVPSGIPSVSTFTFSNYTQGGTAVSPCINENLYIYPILSAGSGNVLQTEWQVNNCTLLSSANGYCQILSPSSIYTAFTVKYRYKNANGWSAWATVYGSTRNCAGGEDPYRAPAGYTIAYPHLVSGILIVGFDQETVTQVKASRQTIDQIFRLDVKLYNSLGILQRQAISSGENVIFDLSGLNNGIYVLHVYDGIADKPEVHKIIVSHY
jgi:hypothetical protein